MESHILQACLIVISSLQMDVFSRVPKQGLHWTGNRASYPILHFCYSNANENVQLDIQFSVIFFRQVEYFGSFWSVKGFSAF